MKKLRTIKMVMVLIVGLSASVGYTCYKKKQCCNRDFAGNLQCITKCNYEFCPYNYPLEID